MVRCAPTLFEQEVLRHAVRPKGPSLAEMMGGEMGGEMGGHNHGETIPRDHPDAQAPLGGWRLPLRLGAEQVARLVARQAIELDILGLPPAVSLEYPHQEAMDQRFILAQKQREGVALRRQELALRQMADMQETRQHVLRGREEEEAHRGWSPEAHRDDHGGGGDATEASEADAAAAAAAAHQLSAAKQLLQMQRMLHSNAVVKAEEAIEKAEVERDTPTLALTLTTSTLTTPDPTFNPASTPTRTPTLTSTPTPTQVKREILQDKLEQANSVRRWYAESRRDLQDEKQLELGEQREQVRTHPYP